MKYTRETIIDLYDSEKRDVIAFWGHTPNPKKITKACLSQWYDCAFEVDGERFHTSEQYMMAEKASLFEDFEIEKKIMEADNPADYKALGRQVKYYDDELWDRNKYHIVLRGNIAKFSQNPELWEFLDGTGDSILVEASPYDDIWGVKLSADDPRINDPSQWKGENLLGCILMETRDILRWRKNYEWDEPDWIGFNRNHVQDGDDIYCYTYCCVGFMREKEKWGILRDDYSEIVKEETVVFYPQFDECRMTGSGYLTTDRAEILWLTDDYAVIENAYYFVTVRKGEKYGIVDTAGRVITPCKWDEIDRYGNARRGELWGFVNLITCEETVPQWQENQRLNPYRNVWSAHELMGFSQPKWIKTMELFSMR